MRNLEKGKQLDCSVRNLLETSMPVIISMLSGVLMSALDRILLSRYSLDSMNAVSFANNLINVIALPLLSFAGISEVFVGQFNGAKLFKKTTQPIGQISIALIACWALLAPFVMIYFCHVIENNHFQEGITYFIINMFMIPFWFVFSSITAFFVGTRRPSITLYSAVISNIVNLILDVILIFGIKGVIPAMGAKGAAIASLIAIIVAVAIMLAFYFSAHNAEFYGSRHFSFSWPLLKKNIVLGAPYAVCDFLEMAFWAWVLILLEKFSRDAVTVHNISVILWVFLTFVTEGLQKGVMALASNCIGSHQEFLIKKLMGTMVKIAIFVSLVTMIPLIIYPETLLKHVFHITDQNLFPVFRQVLFFVWGEMGLLIISFSCLSGILSSGGDTTFVMLVKLLNLGLCMTLPLFILYKMGRLDAVTSWKLSFLSQFVNMGFFYARYCSGKWRHVLIS